MQSEYNFKKNDIVIAVEDRAYINIIKGQKYRIERAYEDGVDFTRLIDNTKGWGYNKRFKPLPTSKLSDNDPLGLLQIK